MMFESNGGEFDGSWEGTEDLFGCSGAKWCCEGTWGRICAEGGICEVTMN